MIIERDACRSVKMLNRFYAGSVLKKCRAVTQERCGELSQHVDGIIASFSSEKFTAVFYCFF